MAGEARRIFFMVLACVRIGLDPPGVNFTA